VWDRDGQLVQEIARIGLLDSIPIEFGATRTSPCRIGWHADGACVLKWTEAQDGGDSRKFLNVSPRDNVYAVDRFKPGSGDRGPITTGWILPANSCNAPVTPVPPWCADKRWTSKRTSAIRMLQLVM
jgi:hypothetical protein